MSERQTDWHQVKVSDLLTEHSERSTSSNQFEVLSVTKDGILSQREYFKKQIASKDNSGYKVVRRGDVVFSAMNLWMGSIDVVKDQEIGIVSPAYITMRPNNELIDTDFLGYFLRGEGMRKKYVQHSQQGASIVRRNLNKNDLLNDEVFIPPLPEQKKIAKILSGVNHASEKIKDLLSKQKYILNSLISDLLFGDRESIRHACLDELSERITDGTHQAVKTSTDGEIPFLYVSCIRNRTIDWGKTGFINEEQYSTASQGRQPIPGDILYTAVGATYGHAAMVQTDFRFCFQRHIALIQPKRDKAFPKFIELALSSNEVKRMADAVVAGNAQPSITLGELKRLRIPAPPMKRQEEIAEIVRPVEELVAATAKRLEHLQFIKKSVSSDLLSGRKRVSV